MNQKQLGIIDDCTPHCVPMIYLPNVRLIGNRQITQQLTAS